MKMIFPGNLSDMLKILSVFSGICRTPSAGNTQNAYFCGVNSNNDSELVAAALAGDFDLAFNDLVSREKIVTALSWRVEQLIAGNPDQLFSMLYRLDISERKIKAALVTDDDIPKKIAVLIYERQLEKIISRRQFKSDHPEDDLAW